MSNLILRNVLRFVFLLLLQIMILNYIPIPYGFQAYIYIICILLLPYQIKEWWLLIIAFLTGFVMDLFTGVLGLQTASLIAMAFMRILLYRQSGSIYDVVYTGTPTLHTMGWGAFLGKTALLVVFFYTCLFFLEVMSFQMIWQTLYLIAGSSVLVIIPLWMSQILIGSPR